MRIHSITVGTAGHIDHGKSELIGRLTGIHPDRLKEERERGMTIDLGYSFYETAQGLTVGIIDVPGHERFIKNMVAGATSMDLVILVVAADDGVMPQTREHLCIMTTLGVERGIVALTKIDLVDAEMVELASEDIRDLVRGTFLEGAPIVPVSSVTGEGFDRLKEVLDAAVAGTEPRRAGGTFRMPVQRVFSAKGFGTVVTGVPVSGRIRVGDPVEVLPLGERGRIRGIQAYDEPREDGGAGHRTALNISDVDYRSIRRGDVVAAPGAFHAVRFFEADLSCFGEMPFPLKNMTLVRVHTGTAEIMARMALLERKILEPGDRCLVQLRLRDPAVVVPGDPFVLRLHSPLITVGGGRVVGLTQMKLKRFKRYVLERVAARREALSDLKAQVLIEAEGWRDLFFSAGDLAFALNAARPAVEEAVAEGGKEGDLVEVGQGLFMHKGRFERLCGEVTGFLEEQHRASPLLPYTDVNLLRPATGLEGKALQGLLKVMESRRLVETAKGGRVRRAGFVPSPTEEQSRFIERLEERVHDFGATPPPVDELLEGADLSGAEAESALQFLVETGRFVRVGPFVFHADRIEEMRRAIVETARDEGEVKIPLIRDRFRTSRKWIIPLMEYFDDIGVTRRVGDKRYLSGSVHEWDH